MKIRTTLVIFTCLSLCACNPPLKKEQPTEQAPKALQDNKSSYELRSKRSGAGILEELYAELVEKDERLKALENGLDQLSESKSDSSKQTNSFTGKNDNYYSQANQYAEHLKDTILKQKVKALLEESLAAYRSSAAGHKELLGTIDLNTARLDDLHTALKIAKTLPVIAKYQQANLPSTKPLQGYLTEQKKMISQADSLLRK